MNRINIKQSRFRDASWFSKIEKLNTPIIVGGVGGIGTWLILFLSRMLNNETELYIYDHDIVEEINMAGQLYGTKHIGKPKVEAIENIVKEFTGFENIFPQYKKYDETSFSCPIMFSAFDNMKARKIMFENWKKEATVFEDSIFIDGRLLAEQLQVFFVTSESIDTYEKEYLFDDSEVESENCSYKQTTHFAANIASKMVQGFTNWLSKDTSELPFYYDEIGGLFLNSVINTKEKEHGKLKQYIS